MRVDVPWQALEQPWQQALMHDLVHAILAPLMVIAHTHACNMVCNMAVYMQGDHVYQHRHALLAP